MLAASPKKFKEPVISPSLSLLTANSQIFKEPVLVYNNGSQKHETVKEQAEVWMVFHEKPSFLEGF